MDYCPTNKTMRPNVDGLRRLWDFITIQQECQGNGLILRDILNNITIFKDNNNNDLLG
jgi:hypothetical protein